MKSNFKGLSLACLCSWFGITRQAYYQNRQCVEKEVIKAEIVLGMVRDIRAGYPRMGGRKLYAKLHNDFADQGIKIGRDNFFDLLRDCNVLVKKRRNYHITTNSNHWMKKYPNLIKELEPFGPNHILVSDITYWKSTNNHYYISFVTDAFSRKIVGYHVAQTMDAVESVAALKMALGGINKDAIDVIHHSDRGAHYCSSIYVSILKKRGIKISMTENGDPLENAIAERINGIIKGEYLFGYPINSIKEAQKVLESCETL